jgi:nucleoside-diphosphate-sugar epimerase
LAKNVKTVVTGGGGFIGSHLVRRLLEEGHEVRVLDNFATGRRENLMEILDAIELVEGDVQSYERAHTAVRGCEVVFHQAALPSVPRSIQDPLTSNASNVVGTLNVLLAARDSDVRRVVFGSSSSIYGANLDLPKREDMPAFPISPYAVAKLAAEGYCRSFFEVYGLETVSLRYFNVFGPRQDPLSQYAAVIPNFITAFLRGQAPTIFGDGEQTRDFTYVENVVEGNVLAADAENASGRIYNIAVGERVGLNEVIELLREMTGRDLEAVYCPDRPGDVRHSLADTSRAERELGYTPKVGFREGLRRTLRFHQEFAARGSEPVSAEASESTGAVGTHMMHEKSPSA